MSDDTKLNNILYILNSINNGEALKNRLCCELGRSSRSVERYINEIDKAGFPVYLDEGKYRFCDNYALAKTKITPEELRMLVFMSETAGALGENFKKTFIDIKNKFISSKKENSAPYFVKLLEGTGFPTNGTTELLRTAIENRNKISFVYEHGKHPLYMQFPVKFIFFDGLWYLLCYNVEENPPFPQKFKLNRISDLKILKDKFRYDEKEINAMLKESGNIWFDTRRSITVKLLVSKNIAGYFCERDVFPQQEIEKGKDGGIIINCKTANYKEILPSVYRWIPHIKVLEPAELATRVQKTVYYYFKTYTDKTNTDTPKV